MDARDLVIVGAAETAELAYEYFTCDSPHRVVAFAVESVFRKSDQLFGLPVVPFESLEREFPPDRHAAFVAISYNRLNRVRRRLFLATRDKGYELLSYVSSAAFVWRNVKIGSNCFVLENNVLQYGVQVGDDVTLWSGNHVGHQTVIEDHCFVSSHVVISGYCRIGAASFLGVNSALADRVTVGADAVLGVGTVVVKDLAPGRVYVGNPAREAGKSSYESFGVPEAER